MNTATSQDMTGASADAIELLTEQHREVEQLWSQLQVPHRDGSNVQTQLARETVTKRPQRDGDRDPARTTPTSTCRTAGRGRPSPVPCPG